MRITVAAVGRGRAASEQGLCDLYWERATALGPKLGISKLDFVIIDVSRAASTAARMDEEAAKLARRLPTPSHRMALDEAGRSLSSEAFAKHLAKLRDRGCPDLVFLIGGPDGLAPGLKDAPQRRPGFGPQPWPPLIVRA